MEAATRSCSSSSDTVNVVTRLPSGRLEGMTGSMLAARMRCFEGRHRQRQRLAMGGRFLIHKRSTGIGDAMLPCLANASRALPRLHGGAARHGWHAHMQGLARLSSARKSPDLAVLYVRVFVLSCRCCS